MALVSSPSIAKHVNGNRKVTHCKNGHPFDEENTYVSSQGRRHCRVCNKLRMRQVNSTPEAKQHNVERVATWVNANREHYRDYCRQRRAKTKAWLDEQKAQGCHICGEKNIACLDFHHKDPKTKHFNIGVVSSTMSLKKIKVEVAKTEVICCNCHRKLHAAERVSEGRVAISSL